MDPKTLANLDPKLRETYERVMGSSGTSPAPATAPSPTPAPASPVIPQSPASPATSATPSTDIVNSPAAAESPKPAEPDNGFKASAAFPPTIFNTTPSAEPTLSSATTPVPPPATATPTAPASPVPPPISTAPTVPAPNSIDTFSLNSAQSAQAADLAGLQPSLMGVPLKETKEAELQLSKPLQPLPSPASVNQQSPSASVVASAQSPSTLIRVLYILAGIIFFVVYAVFWLKIFHYPLPF